MGTKRQELEQQIDEELVDAEQFMSSMSLSYEDVAELTDLMSYIPFMKALPRERQMNIARVLGTNLIEFVFEGFKKELAAFCTYWKSNLPPDEECERLTKAEIEEKINAPFLHEMDDLFNAWTEKIGKLMKGEPLE